VAIAIKRQEIAIYRKRNQMPVILSVPTNMESESKPFQQCQRVQVTRDTQGAEVVIRISLERHDTALGWYTAGSMCIPLCQLPVLEQALDEMSASQCLISIKTTCAETGCARKIIPFPLLALANAAEPVAETAN
jgi:hypothetical protein